jgi:two-component system phosphate regulon sensor histidine kinase PhoR
MFRSRLYAETVRPYAAFVLASAVLFAWLAGHWYGRALREGELNRVAAVASAVAQQRNLFDADRESGSAALVRIAESTDVRLTVVDAQGVAISDTGGDASLFGDLRHLPELRLARNRGETIAEIVDDAQIVVVVPIPARLDHVSNPAHPSTSSVAGFVRAEGSPGEIRVRVWRWRLWAFVITASFGAIGALLAARTVRRLDAAIERIARSARFAIGRPDAATSQPSHNESLSATLTAVAAALDRESERSSREAAQLQAGAERLSTVLASMAEGVLAVARDERILVANPAAASLLEVSDAALVGRRLWEAVRVPAIREAARAAFEGRETPQIEVDMPRTQATIALRASPLPGVPTPGAVLVLHDVTELRRLENVRREFVSNVSHELKTPLASIQAYTETLLDGAIDDREHNRLFLKRIAEQAERLHHLILDLLRLAQIEAGTDVFEIRKLSAGKIISRACDEHVAVAKSKRITLAMEPPVEAVRIKADAEGLRTILDNLLDNALHYTPEGGRITVCWGRHDDAAFIEVADTGIGIPPEHLPRVFERFHRVDKARSRDRGGTGLGLAIVKHLVQVFGGRVEVESEVDRGSTFRVTLPLAESRRANADAVPSRPLDV